MEGHDGGRGDGPAAFAARAPWSARGTVALDAVTWCFGSFVLAGLLLRGWIGDALFVTRYTGYLMPWLLVGLVPAAIRAARRRRRALALVLGVSAVIITTLHAPLFRVRPALRAPAQAEVRLRVMSFNTWSRNRDAERIARVIVAQRPDLLLLQEIPADVFRRLVPALGALYGGEVVHHAYDPALMQAVVSRYPLEPRPNPKDEGQTQRVLLRHPLGPVTVFNVHPLRIGGWEYRYRQIAALLEEEVLRERGPVVLGGDLNAPDRSQLYGLVARHLRNAHEEAGFGLGFTYPAAVAVLGGLPALPLVRLDHIFTGGGLVPVHAGTLADSGGSDHRPVFAELAAPAWAP